MIGMKFKFKLGDFFLLTGTIIAFVLSIVLWIFIMTDDQHFNHIDQPNNATQEQAHTHRTKSVYDLYIPTNSYGFNKGKLCRLYDSKNNLSLAFTKELKNIKFKSIKKVSSNQKQYEKLLNDPNFIQLAYPDEVTFHLFTKISMKKGNREFRRIFISSSDKWLYVANDKNSSIYRVKPEKANFSLLRHYAKNAKVKIPIKFVRLKNDYTVFYPKPVRWRVYSYLTDAQSDSYFVSRLLGTSNVATRTSKDGRTTYSLNYYTKLQVPKSGNNNNHNFLYTHYEKVKSPTATSRLLDSVYYVHRLGLNEQNLRFFDADRNTVSYSNYIEGIPVFLNKQDLQADTTFSTDSVVLAFNSLNLQIPIPFDGQTKTLQSTDDVVKSLEKKGLKQSEIQRITVGFKVEKDNSHEGLVNLIPTYYIKAYDQWKNLAEWEKQDFSTSSNFGQQNEGVN